MTRQWIFIFITRYSGFTFISYTSLTSCISYACGTDMFVMHQWIMPIFMYIKRHWNIRHVHLSWINHRSWISIQIPRASKSRSEYLCRILFFASCHNKSVINAYIISILKNNLTYHVRSWVLFINVIIISRSQGSKNLCWFPWTFSRF